MSTEKKSRNRSRKILVPKKVSESVSKKFGTEKSLGIGIVQILSLVTHWLMMAIRMILRKTRANAKIRTMMIAGQWSLLQQESGFCELHHNTFILQQIKMTPGLEHISQIKIFQAVVQCSGDMRPPAGFPGIWARLSKVGAGRDFPTYYNFIHSLQATA